MLSEKMEMGVVIKKVEYFMFFFFGEIDKKMSFYVLFFVVIMNNY